MKPADDQETVENLRSRVAALLATLEVANEKCFALQAKLAVLEAKAEHRDRLAKADAMSGHHKPCTWCGRECSALAGGAQILSLVPAPNRNEMGT